MSADKDFIDGFYRPMWPDLYELRKEAEREYIPIIRRDTEMFLNTVLALIRPKMILEIGSAIGYSAVFFARSCTGANIYTIEKNRYAYSAACSNIMRFGVSKSTECILGDGAEAVSCLRKRMILGFDFIFIDASKSRYKDFLDASLTVARPGAVIFSDDILQHGYTASPDAGTGGKHRTNSRKMNEYLGYICESAFLDTSLLRVGDGLAISIYKG